MPLKCKKCGKTHLSTWPCQKPEGYTPSVPQTSSRDSSNMSRVESPNPSSPSHESEGAAQHAETGKLFRLVDCPEWETIMKAWGDIQERIGCPNCGQNNLGEWCFACDQVQSFFGGLLAGLGQKRVALISSDSSPGAVSVSPPSSSGAAVSQEAEEAAEKIGSYLRSYFEFSELNQGGVNYFSHIIQDAINKSDNADKERLGWISTSERTPTKHDGDEFGMVFARNEIGGCIQNVGIIASWPHIYSYWMPIPALPKQCLSPDTANTTRASETGKEIVNKQSSILSENPTSRETGRNVTVLSEDLLGFRGLLWTLAKQRKESKCWITGLTIYKNEMAWRPQGNSAHRYQRISQYAMNKLRCLMPNASRANKDL